MTNITKTIRCMGCSTDFPLSLTTDLEASDISIVAKCPKCSAAMQLHFGIIAQQQVAQQAQEASPLDTSMFVPPEMPSDELKELIGE